VLQAELPGSSHQSEQFVQSALDALSAHIAILDDSGEIIGINEGWRRFAENNNLSRANHGLGMNYLHVCDTSDGRNSQEAQSVGKGIRDVLTRRRDEFYLEYPCHSSKERRWFVVHITRFDWNGRTRLIVAHQNVTELKEIQNQLEDNRKRLEAILNNVVNGIVTVSASGRLESLNPAAAAIFGYHPKEITGQPLNMLFSEPYRSAHYRSLLSSLQITGERELIGQRKDGTLFPMYFAMSELYLGNRRIYTGIVQDITERKKMEAELIEKERISIALKKERELRDFKNRFIGIMSHELRTPLSSILLSSDLLKLYGERAAPDEKKLYLDNIRTQVGHLASLVKDMLTMSRSEAREIDFAPQEVDLVALCRQITEEFQVTHQETHHLTLKTTGERMVTLLDPKLMRQVVTNLVSNAIKYSSNGTTVRMEVLYETDQIVIRVIDAGIGIPEADLPLLFQPFHRASNAQNLPGTGLGLSIVRQAVELHGGSIDVQSRQNIGTTFTVSLPYRVF
jgi:two-component system, LuxR family, sensor kinase FixL